MAENKKKFSSLTREEKFKIAKTTLTTFVMALAAAAMAVNIFSCDIGVPATVTPVVEQGPDWDKVADSSYWSINATNVTASENIPLIWYSFTTFHVDSAEQGQEHLVTVESGEETDSAYLLLNGDGTGSLTVRDDCIFTVSMIRTNSSTYLMRLRLDDQVIELERNE